MIPIENILGQPLDSMLHPYTSLFGTFPEIFLGIFFILVPTVIVAMKTQSPVPPLMVLIFGNFLVSPMAGDFGRYFMLAGGALLGLLFYIIAKGR